MEVDPITRTATQRQEPILPVTATSEMERLIIVGSGGREDAIGQAIASQSMFDICFAPGNAGTEEYGKNFPYDDAEFIRATSPELVVVGPEKYLASGMTDKLREAGIKVFGPSQVAAKLETSKSFAVEFMQEYQIPHPATQIAYGYDEAKNLIENIPEGTYVIKEDGLRGGKGVYLPETKSEAEEILKKITMKRGDNDPLLFQERLHGQEVSVFALSDGENWTILPFTQDYKRLQDYDKGPNTGGMGAYAPADDIVNAKQRQQIEEIVARTIESMQDDGSPYKGVLYVGVMLAEEKDDSPVVIEYNARFGDPEAQVLMPLLEKNGVPIYDTLYRTDVYGGLRDYDTYLVKNLAHSAVTVCLASEGYPNSDVKKHETIHIDQEATNNPNILIHHGAVERNTYGEKISLGGRVLYVTGLGVDVNDARSSIYSLLENKEVWFEGMQYRNDIAQIQD